MKPKNALIASLIIVAFGIVIAVLGGPIIKSDKAFFIGLIVYAIGSFGGAILSGDKMLNTYLGILGYSAPNANVGCIVFLFLPITMALVMVFSLLLVGIGWIFAIKALVEEE